MERLPGPPDVICPAGKEGSNLLQKIEGEFSNLISCVQFSAMSGMPTISESLVALDVFFLGITSYSR